MTRATHRRLERALRTSWRWGCVLGLAAGLFGKPARADGSNAADKGRIEPWVSLKLSDLGVPIIPQAFMNAGSSMLTLNIIDDTHVLVTFSTRDLVPRIAGDPPDDEDRIVQAEVVELPKGEILARTKWHMHDHGRYLWCLGRGRFLVRSRNTLFTITPEALLNTPDPLRATPFPSRPAIPAAAMVSPDASLVTVESLLNLPKKQDAAMTNGDQPDSPKPEVLMDFYRVAGGVAGKPKMSVARAGVVKSPGLLALPMDGDGYLWPGNQKRGKWEISFNEYGGRTVPVGSVLSSCPPRLQLVSRSEYIAFACRGAEDRLKMEAFGMDGHEVWEESLSSTGMPVFAFAPAAGRFAITRVAAVVADPEGLSVVPDGATQEMRVYQTESGDLLLRAPMSPVIKSGETFDLSEDGMVAAVVNAGAVQVYKLRPLNDQDHKDLKMAAGFCPPVGDGEVNLAKLAKAKPETSSEPVESAEASAEPPTKAEMKPAVDTAAVSAPAKTDVASAGPPAAAPGAATASAGSGAAGSGQAGSGQVLPAGAAGPADPGAAASGDGDADAAGPRKPPTLLEPGEKAEYHPGGTKQSQNK